MASTMDVNENRQHENRVLCIFMTALGLLFMILRLLARWKKGLSVGPDDYTILLSMVNSNSNASNLLLHH